MPPWNSFWPHPFIFRECQKVDFKWKVAISDPWSNFWCVLLCSVFCIMFQLHCKKWNDESVVCLGMDHCTKYQLKHSDTCLLSKISCRIWLTQQKLLKTTTNQSNDVSIEHWFWKTIVEAIQIAHCNGFGRLLHRTVFLPCPVLFKK